MSFAALLEQWAAKYEVHTVLERAVGAGARPACAVLAGRGSHVVAVADDGDVAAELRAAYGPEADVRRAGAAGELPKSDLVVVHGGRLEGDWRAELAALGALASKLLVLEVDNPKEWRARARSLAARLTGGNGHAEAWGRTEDLAPVLWGIGRVREHVYLDAPSVGAGASRLERHLAARHVLLVDVTPRTPQARRKLRLKTA